MITSVMGSKLEGAVAGSLGGMGFQSFEGS